MQITNLRTRTSAKPLMQKRAGFGDQRRAHCLPWGVFGIYPIREFATLAVTASTGVLGGLTPKAIKALRLSIAETRFSGFRNHHDRRMFQFAVQRNRVEPLQHIAEVADDIYLVLLLHFRGDHRWCEE
jgi:hypothetical protein